MKFNKIKITAITLFMSLCMTLLTPLKASALEKPDVSHGDAYIVYCAEPDAVLWSENPDAQVYPAALTKLMTAVITADRITEGKLGLDDYAEASKTAVRGTIGNNIDIKTGERLSIRDLLGALFLAGANDAALVLAEKVSGSVNEFVKEMNLKAEELGMKHTVYTNPTGLHDSKMVTTASDLLILAKYASRIHFLSEIYSKIRITIGATDKSDTRYIGTRNYLISKRVNADYFLSSATGMICGSTNEGGFCIIASAQYNGLNYITIVMGADTDRILKSPAVTETDEDGNTVVVKPAEYRYIMNGFVESADLIKWAQKNFGYIKAVDSSTPVCQIPVKLAESVDNVALLPEKPIEIFVPFDIDRNKDIELSWDFEKDCLTAPVKAGEKAGILTVRYKGTEIGKVNLIVKTNIVQSSGLTFLNRVEQLVRTPFFIVVIVLITVGALVYIFATAVNRSKKKAAAKREFMKRKRYIGDGK